MRDTILAAMLLVLVIGWLFRAPIRAVWKWARRRKPGITATWQPPRNKWEEDNA